MFVERLTVNIVSIDSATTEEALRSDETSVAWPRMQLPGEWAEARKALEERLDESMDTTSAPSIHAVEPVIPVAQSTDQEIKCQAQLSELEQMGFMNRSLNGH